MGTGIGVPGAANSPPKAAWHVVSLHSNMVAFLSRDLVVRP
jgi:hypothetical protein